MSAQNIQTLAHRSTLSAHHSPLKHALRLAAYGIGNTGENPSVGCVIVKNNEVIGLGRTAQSGRPHAETQALAMAAADAKGATLYVTLEPCAHHGHTAPCAEAIIQAGITTAIIACRDPDPRVSGKGIAMLKAAGIEVIENVLNEEALEVNRGFFSRITRHRPWVMLKIATSADGFIAKENGDSKWITGIAARRHGHMLRARNNAILTGSGTFLADAPQLNVRIAGLEHASPMRYVLDRRSRVQSSEFRVLQDEKLEEVMNKLATEGVNHLMIEAGAALSAAFCEAELVDDLYWYRAPKLMHSGIAFIAPNLPAILSHHVLESDTLSVYRFTSPQSLIKG